MELSLVPLYVKPKIILASINYINTQKENYTLSHICNMSTLTKSKFVFIYIPYTYVNPLHWINFIIKIN